VFSNRLFGVRYGDSFGIFAMPQMARTTRLHPVLRTPGPLGGRRGAWPKPFTFVFRPVVFASSGKHSRLICGPQEFHTTYACVTW